ncbi:ABC transporter ATP-binding protein [Pseudarthrobacter sp. J75]|uniref:ABC transporter ATP-binding protein n=1 Tax=unclassified Pseudarthrobacter TaxID=2647000 RepID=UPI002E8209DF|nr:MULTISPECIES: ABC transporter ATP-binding protein [unclassified Pseudarthrobacter]MEE2523782.1 ABC transporter ATP-binding protein [Pseudarthrobacter sp. J47]MEE2529948.1 ABC transporter ATP-binding protein [Pseudarthrobacter sp. J75]
MKPLLDITDLTVANLRHLRPAAGGSAPASLIHGLSLSVNEGEFVALVGGSGSGKTLTALSAVRLLPDPLAITAGAIRLGSVDVTTAAESELNTVRGGEAGMLFQQPKRVLNPNRTIGAHLLEPLKVHRGLRGAPARTAAVELLREVGFADAPKGFGSYPHQLSGGMAQRAMTAVALAGQPRLLLADEPTSALDKVLERQVLQLLDRERRDRGLGILYITHNIASVAPFADRVLVMDSGTIVEEGPTARIIAAPKTAYTRELLAASQLAPESGRRPRPAPREVLTLAGLHKRFGRGRRAHTALDNVSLSLQHGEILGVLGQSGSGKSTLARAIVGLEKTDGGTMTRHPAEGASAPPAATAVQLVFQEPHGSFDPRMTLRASMEAPLQRRRDLNAGARARRIAEVMADVELDAALLDRHPGQCSGGQLQRATIARALLLDPTILICDEATSALDALTQRTVLNLLLRLQREHSLSLVVISHDMDVIRYMCDRVAVLLHGAVIEVAETQAFFAGPSHEHSRALVDAAIPCRWDHLRTLMPGAAPA